jgi:hypothetical protein
MGSPGGVFSGPSVYGAGQLGSSPIGGSSYNPYASQLLGLGGATSDATNSSGSGNSGASPNSMTPSGNITNGAQNATTDAAGFTNAQGSTTGMSPTQQQGVLNYLAQLFGGSGHLGGGTGGGQYANQANQNNAFGNYINQLGSAKVGTTGAPNSLSLPSGGGITGFGNMKSGQMSL